jgi:hypothetical protein
MCRDTKAQHAPLDCFCCSVVCGAVENVLDQGEQQGFRLSVSRSGGSRLWQSGLLVWCVLTHICNSPPAMNTACLVAGNTLPTVCRVQQRVVLQSCVPKAPTLFRCGSKSSKSCNLQCKDRSHLHCLSVCCSSSRWQVKLLDVEP